ncbi:MAG: DEAD/DEAH box helicase [Polyangia bacterium]
MSTFARFPPRLQDAIVSRLGWTSLRPVQELAGEAILDGKNAVVLAPTAGGKTEAAIFPAIATLMENPPTGVGLIYIAPIKALLNNQEERLGTYADMVGLRRFVWHGDVGDAAKKRFKEEPVEILMTTPESLEVMLISPRCPTQRLFGDLRMVIIDEIHAMAGTDRGAHLMSVIERLASFSRHDIQRVGLSATVGNPTEILGWMQGGSKRPGEVIDPPKAAAPRQIQVCLHETIVEIAQDAAARASGKKSLFFCQSRALSETVAERMRGRGAEVFVHHSSVSREERREAEARFHHGTDAAIVCTSTLELGIDVGDLDLVFQANAPSTVSSFMQRMGRTGRRAGQVANTTFFCESPEDVLQAVAIVELARKGWVESVPVQDRCWPVLVHQILAQALQFGAISPERCFELLARVPDFRGITPAERTHLIEHLTKEEYLFESGGLLSMGTKAERIFGRKNFAELYAVFSSPVMYGVETETGRDLGSLDQDFADRLVEEMSSFLLAGRAWTVVRLDHKERTVVVREAPRGQKPSWGGYLPQLLGFEICQQVRQILVDTTDYPYLDAAARAAIATWRADLGDLLRRSHHIAAQQDDRAVRLWTFAGGRINHTLKYALELIGGWKAVADNFALRIEGDGVSHATVDEALAKMRAAGFWKSGETRTAIRARVPPFRLSKFQRALPPEAETEFVARSFLDFEGAERVVGGVTWWKSAIE